MEKELNGKMCQIPAHVAIILDGNGRWAKKRFKPFSTAKRPPPEKLHSKTALWNSHRAVPISLFYSLRLTPERAP